MTIALGILASNGAVIAADTQESTGYLKGASNKILIGIQTDNQPNQPDGILRPLPMCSIAVSGAGHAGYLDAVMQEVVDGFLDDKKTGMLEIQKAFRDRIRDFYKAHVLPFSKAPDYEDLEFSTIVGATARHNQRFLWASDKNTVRHCMPFGAVGLGAAYAKMFLNRLYNAMDVDHAVIVAAYTVFMVKDCIEGCGKDTHIVRMQDGAVTYVPAEKVKKLEGTFASYGAIETCVFRYATGHSLPDSDNDLSQIMEWLRNIRKDFTE